LHRVIIAPDSDSKIILISSYLLVTPVYTVETCHVMFSTRSRVLLFCRFNLFLCFPSRVREIRITRHFDDRTVTRVKPAMCKKRQGQSRVQSVLQRISPGIVALVAQHVPRVNTLHHQTNSVSVEMHEMHWR